MTTRTRRSVHWRKLAFLSGLTTFLMLLMPFLVSAAGAAPASAAANCATFQETGHQVCDRFLEYWQSHGALPINGFPLTEARMEKLEDGKMYQVQWFERVRLELHPENPAPYDVLLGQFGRIIHPADPPVTAKPGMRFFPETGHNMTPDFVAFWEANGGLAQFGFPLTEEISEKLEDGQTYTVQYTERARFERHPENKPPYTILLGQFGRRILNGGGSPSPSPSPSPSNLIFRDNFTDPNSGWPIVNDPQGRYSAGYLSGEYRIALAAANVFALLPNTKVAPQTNTRIEADMKRFGTEQDPFFGLACRASDPANYYAAVIDTQGNAIILKVVGGKVTLLAAAENHPAIKRGNETNRVRFDCNGTQLALIANGSPVIGTLDSSLSSGYFALMGLSFEKGGLDLHVLNFVVTKP